MGVSIPSGSSCYLDSVAIIAGVERIHSLWPKLDPLWQRVLSGDCTFHSSEFSLLEVLVGPLKKSNQAQAGMYESVLASRAFSLVRVTRNILREAAAIRAQIGLKAPDALHAATCIASKCDFFITDDADFKRVPGLPLVMLSDL